MRPGEVSPVEHKGDGRALLSYARTVAVWSHRSRARHGWGGGRVQGAREGARRWRVPVRRNGARDDPFGLTV